VPIPLKLPVNEPVVYELVKLLNELLVTVVAITLLMVNVKLADVDVNAPLISVAI
jgi:hypothetical protein